MNPRLKNKPILFYDEKKFIKKYFIKQSHNKLIIIKKPQNFFRG